MLDRFAAFIDQHQRFLLTTHENPDGDGVGASIGLAGVVAELKKFKPQSLESKRESL